MTRAELITIIRDGLREGLGAEDIAVKHNVPACRVRAEIATLRADGIIPGEVYGGGE